MKLKKRNGTKRFVCHLKHVLKLPCTQCSQCRWDPKPKIQRAYCGRFKQVNMCSSRGELRASDRASPADGGPLADLILHNEAVAARIAKDFLPPKLDKYCLICYG
jgi:hypothetical protein